MAKIVAKRWLNETVLLMEIEAPGIAEKTQTGQFVVIRIDELGERVPFTVADTDQARQTISIIFQVVGASSMHLSELDSGDNIADLLGPLGNPTPIPKAAQRVCIVGGGVGCAVAYPQAKHLLRSGLDVDMITGFRSHDLMFFEPEIRSVVHNLYITTDDGSYGEKGFVTTKLEALINEGQQYDLVIAIGPTIMMKMVCGLTARYGLPTLVSLNPIMVDGTGLCGCCRVTVGGQTRFACVDGPDFDGHLVDFDELMARNAYYAEQEAQALQRFEEHRCRLTGEVR